MEGKKAGRGEARRLMLPVGWRKGRLGAEWSQGVCPAQKGTEGSQGFAVTPKLDERKWKLRETWLEVAQRAQLSRGAAAPPSPWVDVGQAGSTPLLPPRPVLRAPLCLLS